MLGAVMFGHRGFQPVIDAIIRLAERSAKEPRDFAVDDQADLYARVKQSVAEELGRAYSITAKAERHDARRRREGQGEGGALPAGRRGRPVGAAGRRALQEGRERDRPRPHPRGGPPHRRPRPDDGPPDRIGSRHPAAHARLGAVHARRDAGAGRRHARHRRGRADDRQPGGDLQGTLHAALQFPALLGGRDRPHGLARPPRGRPRQARLARRASDAAGGARIPLHAARRLGDHRVRTAPPRWRPCAARRSR